MNELNVQRAREGYEIETASFFKNRDIEFECLRCLEERSFFCFNFAAYRDCVRVSSVVGEVEAVDER